ncbi:MAG: hypothetical protein M3033_16930 [Acidobacteriota bacterium]|nr:hypothetical protein [Acidobacteriota bacterium]
MKQLVYWFFVVFITFALGVAATLIWVKNNSSILPPERSSGSSELPILAYCELVNNPEKYNGKIIRINADLLWNMHGYFLADNNCSARDESALTGIRFDEKSRDELFQKINEIKGSDKLDFRTSINMIAVGKFNKVGRCEICSDLMIDRTLLHFEIIEIEKGYAVTRR